MILDQLADHARERVRREREMVPLEALREQALMMDPAPRDEAGRLPFASALAKEGLSLICELKKASPSKGIIANDFAYLDIASEYQIGGADAISCLTEPKWFLGSDDIFREVRASVAVPMLRKDFTVDDYQIFQAKVLGANAVLLIVSLLETAQLEKALLVCENLGMDALVEAHDAGQVKRALEAGAKIVGVNNRNLHDFSVDPNNAAQLRELVPPDKLFVAESGIACIDDAVAADLAGADAVLVGEFLMRATDRVRVLEEMKAVTR